MTHQAEPPHTAIRISCPHCRQEQHVYVAPYVGIAKPGTQAFKCAKCKGHISVTIPGRIVGEPFEK